MSNNPATSHSKSPLDAAQKIVAELHGMSPEHQLLAVRFATETLGLQISPTGSQNMNLPQGTIQPVAPPAPLGAANAHSNDIRAFTTLKAPKSDQQFTAVVAYFYQFEAKSDERKDAITAEDMKEAARLAARPQVQRWSMTLNNAKNAGYLDGAGDGKYKLSSVGENLVAITLPGNGNAVVKSSRKPAKRVAAKKKVGKKAPSRQ